MWKFLKTTFRVVVLVCSHLSGMGEVCHLLPAVPLGAWTLQNVCAVVVCVCSIVAAFGAATGAAAV